MWAFNAIYEMTGWAVYLLMVAGVILGVAVGRFSVLGPGGQWVNRPQGRPPATGPRRTPRPKS